MAQPALAEVRVTCPACGGAIHPIAGRCKHCKADLVIARGGATGAIGSVIQLGSLAPPASGPTPGLPSGPPAGSALPVTAAPEAAVMVGAAPAPRRRPGGLRRRWPLLVAAIAAVAIVVSVAVLLFSGDAKAKKRRRALGPAPDRMQTDQLPTDPWKDPKATDPGQLQPVPQAPPPDVSPTDPDPPPAPNPPPTAGSGGVDTVDQFVKSLVETTCQRLSACWGTPGARDMCAQLESFTTDASIFAPSCDRYQPDAARECVAAIAKIPCPDADVPVSDVMGMMAGIDACIRVCQ